jgi:hypothetical protein
MGLMRENVYLCDVQVSSCLVHAYEDCNCFGEVNFFVMSKVSKQNKERLGFVQKYGKQLLKRF